MSKQIYFELCHSSFDGGVPIQAFAFEQRELAEKMLRIYRARYKSNDMEGVILNIKRANLSDAVFKWHVCIDVHMKRIDNANFSDHNYKLYWESVKETASQYHCVLELSHGNSHPPKHIVVISDCPETALRVADDLVEKLKIGSYSPDKSTEDTTLWA